METTNNPEVQPEDRAAQIPVHILVMPKGEDYFVNETVKSMILGGYESVKEQGTNGHGIVDLDDLEGFLAGVIDAGLQIQEQINSYDKVNYHTGKQQGA